MHANNIIRSQSQGKGGQRADVVRYGGGEQGVRLNEM